MGWAVRQRRVSRSAQKERICVIGVGRHRVSLIGECHADRSPIGTGGAAAIAHVPLLLEDHASAAIITGASLRQPGSAQICLRVWLERRKDVSLSEIRSRDVLSALWSAAQRPRPAFGAEAAPPEPRPGKVT